MGSLTAVSAPAALPPGSGLVLLGVAALVLGWLWLAAKFRRARLARSVSRLLSADTGRPRRSALGDRRRVARAAASRRADRRFLKALLVTALLGAAWLLVELHPHTPAR